MDLLTECHRNGRSYAALDDSDATPAVRLNVGAGATHLVGFENVDRKLGMEAYPLARPDGSVDEMMCSHVLEHFSHRDTFTVLSDWVRALKPGGKIRLAVPDFEMVAKDYLAGKPVNVQGYTMGGQSDGNDFHGAIFDRESLTELMITCGLERIGPWKSDLAGCSSLIYSLNLQGFKPSGPERELKNVRACMSTPRFGPLMHPRCAEKAFQQLRIPATSGQSCYWHQMLSNKIEEAVADPACEFVLTLDFDTIFSAADVLELYRLLRACPDVDAVFPLQAKRGCEQVLFNLGRTVTTGDVGRNLLPADTGHFGLTLLRAEALRKFPRPWMLPEPNADGRWVDGQTDADISFWRRWRAAGFTCCLAPRVAVGHLEEVVKWPGKDLRPIYQPTGEYSEVGIPAEVVR